MPVNPGQPHIPTPCSFLADVCNWLYSTPSALSILTHSMSPVSDSIVFKGDVSADVQAQIRRFADAVVSRGAFAHSVGSKLVATEVEISTRKKDGKPQCRMMFETTVDDGACACSRYKEGRW